MTDFFVPPTTAERIRGKTPEEVAEQEGLEHLQATILLAMLKVQDEEERRVIALSN